MKFDELLVVVVFFIIVFFTTMFSLYMVASLSVSTKIELTKDRWACTQDSKYTSLVATGKVPMPVTNTRCDQYTRID